MLNPLDGPSMMRLKRLGGSLLSIQEALLDINGLKVSSLLTSKGASWMYI